MALKRSGPATEYEEIDRWDDGVGWIAYPDETMRRASHALETGRDEDGEASVWVVDPVDAPEVDELFAEFGDVAGVVVLLNRHYRDADAIARRHDVPVYVPSWFDTVPAMDAELRRLDGRLPGTDYRLFEVLDRFGWEEAALYDETGGTLVVPEAVGNAPYFTTREERLGVHPMLRAVPPSALRGLRPERVLVGHGPGVLSGGDRALADALDGSRRRMPKLYAQSLRMLLRG